MPELVEHDVVGLDVPMDDAALGGVSQRAAGLDQQPADLGRVQLLPILHDGGERSAAQVLHHEVDHPARATDPVNRNDVGMLELGGGTGLALKALDELGVERERERQHLDGHLALERPVARAVDHRHAPAPQLLQDLVLGGERFAHEVGLLE